MRVIAGLAKGRRLAVPKGIDVRPMTDMVRGALFNHLGDVSGLVGLDLFAGSGAIGIEALSRGAAAVTFVDSAPRAVATVRANVLAAGFGDAATVVRADAGAFCERRPPRPWDLVFVDPPYAVPLACLDRIAAGLSGPGRLTPGARIVSERPQGAPDPPWPEGAELRLRRAFGQTILFVAGFQAAEWVARDKGDDT